MNAGFLAVLAALAAARALNNRNKPPGQQAVGAFGTWALFVWTVIAPVGLAFGISILAGQAWAVLPFLAVAAIVFPWPVSKLVLIPLGLPRVAYWLTFTSDLAFHLDRRGGAALAAAWALGMQRRPRDDDADWIAARLAAEVPLRGAGVAATALLLAARGDRDGARRLLDVVSRIDDRACPEAARRVAHAWLASDAAERGEWSRAAAHGQTLLQGGPRAWLVSGIASALLLEPSAPSKPGLWIRWILAPHRAATKPMVERAVAALEGAFIDPEEEPPLQPNAAIESSDAIRTALALHAAVLARPSDAVRPEDVRAVGQAWDAALSDRATERLLEERALVLGAGTAASTLRRVREAIEEDLAMIVLATGMPSKELGDTGEITARVRARLRDGLLSEVEAASDAIRRRVDDKREIPPSDEWREWANLVACYERGVSGAGDDFRRLAFVKVHPDACALAVWLFNDRRQRPLGNAIFRWLLAEAEALDDQRAIALQTKNVSCGV